MTPTRDPGRVAGLWYLLLTLLGPIRLMYVPGKLFASGNAAATVENIAAHQRLFRLGIAAELMGAIVLIFLVLAFYRLFEGVDRNLAVQVVVFGGVMPAVVNFFQAALDLTVSALAGGADFAPAFSGAQRDGLVMLLFQIYNRSNTAAELLWGLWLFPLGVLVYRSRFLPRFLGVWLIVNGFAYAIICFTGIFAPEFQGAVFNRSFPLLLGEIALMLWLVIRGARPTELTPAAD